MVGRGRGEHVALKDIFDRDDFPRWAVVVVGFALNALLGALDYYTGHELVLSSFYVLPIGLVVWFVGPALGVCTAVISAGIWLTADVADGLYSTWPIMSLNTVIRLGLFLIIVYVLSVLHNAIRHLQRASRVDNLTGAVNSASLYESLESELDRLGRYGRPLTLAYLDLDGFKAVNDGFGHLVGDKVLRVVADCAKSRLRKTDVVARMGGDEFVFLCPETGEEAARAAVSEVVERLSEEMRAGGWPVTVSVGVVTCHEMPLDGEELVKMADDLMYSVKMDTKDGVKFGSFGCAQSAIPLCDEETLLDALRE
jgi:diguanylate cyclase (GGDEF)-like protein